MTHAEYLKAAEYPLLNRKEITQYLRGFKGKQVIIARGNKQTYLATDIKLNKETLDIQFTNHVTGKLHNIMATKFILAPNK